MIRKCPSCQRVITGDEVYCPQCGAVLSAVSVSRALPDPIPSAARAVKHPMTRKSKVVYTLVAASLFTGFLYFYVVNLPGKPNPLIENQPTVAMAAAYAGEPLEQQDITATVENGFITIPLTVVLDKKIVAFDYNAGTTIIPLMAFINTNGKLVTAIRLCEPCNSKKFRIEGNILACGNCETQWRLNNLEGLQGNCQKYPPAPIPSEVVNDVVRIDENVVRSWKIRM
ncbi:MAG: Fe-S-containing protein [Bacteroidota bacterium]